MLNDTQLAQLLLFVHQQDAPTPIDPSAFLREKQRRGDEVRADVLLEMLGVSPRLKQHVAIVLHERLSEGQDITAGELAATLRALGPASKPHLPAVERFTTKAIQGLVNNCPSTSIVDRLAKDARDRRFLEVGPVFSSWPREILEDRRWNTIESPVPGMKDLPLTDTWIHLRLRLAEGRPFGIGRRDVASDASLPNKLHPIYLDQEFEDGLIGEPIEDVLYGIRGLTAILGSPGSGKSTLLKWLARFLVTDEKCPFVVPVFISLREYSLESEEDPSLDLFTYFLRKRAVSDPDQVNRWFNVREQLKEAPRFNTAHEVFFWLLDGWDEVPLKLRDGLVKQLQSIAREPGVITSRHSASPLTLPCDHFYEIAILSSHAQDLLVTSWLDAMGRSQFKEQVLARIGSTHDLRRLSRNPMLLTLLCGLLSEQGTSSAARRIHSKNDLYRETVRRIASHHTKRYPGRPFNADRLGQVSKLAHWLLLESRAAPSYLFVADDVTQATGDEGLFSRILRPSRLVGSPSADATAFQFIHASFQEYLAAQWVRDHAAEFVPASTTRLFHVAGWREIGRFLAGGPTQGTFGERFWKSVRDALSQRDQYGVLLAHVATMLAEASVSDGGKRLIGIDLRPQLWTLIVKHRCHHPFLLIDALLELDAAAFLRFARQLLAKSQGDRPQDALPFLRHLREDIVFSCTDAEGPHLDVPDNAHDSLAQDITRAVHLRDFGGFVDLFHKVPQDEDGWSIQDQALDLAPEFGEKAVNFLVSILTSTTVHPSVRVTAAFALAKCESDHAKTSLVTLLLKTKPNDSLLISLLGAIDGHLLTSGEARYVMWLLTESTSSEVRAQAASVLSSSRAPGTAGHLLGAYEKERNASVRADILNALIDLSDQSALVALWDVMQRLIKAKPLRSNETRAALLAVVSTAAKRPHLRQNIQILEDVSTLVSQWLRKPGHPLASVGAQAAIGLSYRLATLLIELLEERRQPTVVLTEVCGTIGRLRLGEAVPVLRRLAAEPAGVDDKEHGSLSAAAADALAQIAPSTLLRLKSPAADRARAILAYQQQVLYYPGAVIAPGDEPLATATSGDGKMRESYDVGVFVALDEEFGHLDKLLGKKTGSFKDSEVALTYHTYEVPVHGKAEPCRVAVCTSAETGTLRAAECAAGLVRNCRPPNLIVIGIAGSLSEDLKLGDVLLPKEVVDYLADSAAVDTDKGWVFEPSGNAFRSSQELLNAVRNLKHTSADHFAAWSRKRSSAHKKLIDAGVLEKLVEKDYVRSKPIILADDAKLASGPSVGKSDAFAEWVRGIGRKFVALEMESAGVYDSADLMRKTVQPRLLAIRGISDFADKRKKKVEKSSKGLLRVLAMQNAASVFVLAIQCGVFATSQD